MRIRVSFFERSPAADMSQDEVVSWLLGCLGETGFASGLLAAWTIESMVKSLRDGDEKEIDTPQGSYLLSVTSGRHRLRQTRTYHVRER